MLSVAASSSCPAGVGVVIVVVVIVVNLSYIDSTMSDSFTNLSDSQKGEV